ncbi:hypothetical protein MKW92_030478 [Papaver armeniacum]|nr:hypothetical protein MKW92_030478 [Papaver armeniacum]
MSDVLGEGRLGRVYKGFLKNGQEVAVKRFDEQADLLEEVQMLSCVEHSNIVRMIGYCNEGKDRVIVYELMPLKSLNLHLRDLKPSKKPLDWKTRMKIAEGVAKALEYLHNQKDPPVIWWLEKYQYITFDENYNPKLSDFGCAKHGPTWDYLPIRTKMMRGYGYIAPEYCWNGILTLKSDVFSFGVVLLELISGQKVVEENIRGSGRHNIVSWARPLLDDIKNFPEIVDPLMKGQYPYHGLVHAFCIAEVVTILNIVSQSYAETQGTTEADPLTPPTML